MRKATFALGAGAAAVGGAALWWRKNPSACPYGQRFWVEAPHPLHHPAAAARDPRAGSRASGSSRSGPGTGYYALAVASWLAPDGSLAIFDIQQEMLDHTMRRAGEHGDREHQPRPRRRARPSVCRRHLRRRLPRHRARRDPRPGGGAARARPRREAGRTGRRRRAARRPARGEPGKLTERAPRRRAALRAPRRQARSATSRASRWARRRGPQGRVKAPSRWFPA